MQNPETMRERLFTMRMSEDEHARAIAVAEHYGLNIAGAVRMLFKREADAIAEHAQRLPILGGTKGAPKKR